MTPAQELLTSIKAKRVEQAKLLTELDLFAAVQAQGIDIGTVAAFGFKLGFTGCAVATPAQRLCSCDKPEWLQPSVYNFVRRRDGTITRLQPSLRAL